MESRYGDLTQHLHYVHSYRKSSIWWRDLCLLEAENDPTSRWFTNAIKRSAKYGDQTSFWNDLWLDNYFTLKDQYLRLYFCSLTRNAKVIDMGLWENDVWHWDWRWRRNFFQWEEEEFNHLNQLVSGVYLRREDSDEWIWKEDSTR